MKWIKLENENLPGHVVLAANFKKGTYGYREKNIGYLFGDDEMIICDGIELLENCTHYIDMDNYDIL